MLKPALIVFAAIVASLWIGCGYLLWFDRSAEPLVQPVTPGALSHTEKRVEAPTVLPAAAARPGTQTISDSVSRPTAAARTGTEATSDPVSRSAAAARKDTEAISDPVAAVPAVPSTAHSLSRDARDEPGLRGGMHATEMPAPRSAGPPAAAVPQYTAMDGYILDGDSVVIAPPLAGPGSNNPADRRRRARLSMDVGTLP